MMDSALPRDFVKGEGLPIEELLAFYKGPVPEGALAEIVRLKARVNALREEMAMRVSHYRDCLSWHDKKCTCGLCELIGEAE